LESHPTELKAMLDSNLQVCHLSKYYPPAKGGIETHVRTLAKAQAELGASVRVLCVNHQSGPTIVEQDGPVEVVRVRRLASVAKIDVCLDLVGELQKSNADVLHLHVPNPTMIMALLAARQVADSIVVTYHSDAIKQRVRRTLFRPLERRFYRRVQMILPTSPKYVGGSSFLQSYADRLHVLPLGIDLSPYLDPSAEDRAEADRIRNRQAGPLWFSCGRMVYYKGFEVAIQALAQVPGTLLLAGDGPARSRLEAEAKRLGLVDRVIFLGAVPRVLPYYLAAEAFWFPSNARSEAFGIVQVEAMASGCPVINTSIPDSGVSWVSPHEETGLTVPVDDADALAASARRLLEEPGLRDRLAAEARARAAKEFDHRVMAQRSLAIYNQVLRGEPADRLDDRPMLVERG
jgi:glycosyltransferase involved in cell wall biosynthesis